MNNQRSERIVRVYGCGGCGVNIGQLLENQRGSKSLSIANIETAYIDTSSSNINDAVPEKDLYLIEGLDGSGKIRKENHLEIAKRTQDILTSHTPGDLNIVVHSAAGGSGSVVGPSLVSELLSKGFPTIVLMVGSADTVLDAQNTHKTLKSYEAISELREVPVVMVYIQNNKVNKRELVNQSMHSTIISLALLWSGNNRELDSKDLYNFLNFQVTTTYAPQLAHLSVFGANELNELKGAHVISVATLVRDGQESSLEPTPEVQFVGYVRDDAPTEVLADLPLHFIVTDGVFEDADKGLSLILKNTETQLKSRVSRGKILGDGDKPTSSGLVL